VLVWPPGLESLLITRFYASVTQSVAMTMMTAEKETLGQKIMIDITLALDESLRQFEQVRRPVKSLRSRSRKISATFISLSQVSNVKLRKRETSHVSQKLYVKF
jgi:hypothetical protein